MRGWFSASGEEWALAGALKDGLDAVGDRVIAEIRNAEQAFCRLESVADKDFMLGIPAQPNRGEIKTGEHQHDEVPDAVIA